MKALLLALQYAPYVLAAVQAVQVSLAGHPGATKKAAVLAAVQAASAVGEKVPEEHVHVIGALIDAQVASLHESGVFAPTVAVAA